MNQGRGNTKMRSVPSGDLDAPKRAQARNFSLQDSPGTSPQKKQTLVNIEWIKSTKNAPIKLINLVSAS